MARLHDKQDKLTITNKLHLTKNATFKVDQSDGTTTTLEVAELAALNDISATELGFLDGVTAGTGAASKALVLDSSGDVTMPGVITFAEPQEYDLNTGITAFATGGQASATALTGEYNNVTTCATAGDSVKLPTAAAGLVIHVKNSGAASLAVFPASGDAINALAADLSVNIPVGGMKTFHAIDGTTWETDEVVSVSAPTTQTGEFGIKATDSSGDYEILLTNASHGQSTVHSIPDPGGATGTLVLEEVTNVFDLPQRYDHNTGITAFAGGGQGSATALTGEFNNITTCATNYDSVALPTAAAGLSVTVKNSGASILSVFPASGDAINALAADLSVDVPVGGLTTFYAIDGTTWETQEALYSSGPSTQKGGLAIKAADNASNVDVTVTNASHGQATTITLADAGSASTFLLQSTANITDAQATVLSVDAGVGTASRAVVLNGSGNFNMPDGGLFNVSADTVAAAGTGQSDATALTDQINIVTGADGVKGVALPTAADLGEYVVVNDSPVYALFVYTVNAGDDVINELGATDPFILGPGRTATFKAISATQWYADKQAGRPSRETHFEVFDDFLDASIDTTNNWIVFSGTDGDATSAATVANTPEGQILMGSGDGAASEDGSVLSLIALAQGSLVSLGTTVFECRVSFDQLTGVTSWFGLSDKLATTAEHPIHLVDSGTVSDGGLTVANAVGFAFSSDATASTKWQYTSENADTIGNSAAEEASASGPTANTFDVLRIEVDADGTARFYLNGALETTRTSAVATTSLLIPYVAIDAGADAQVVTDLTLDYILFQGARPSSNA